MKLIHLPSTALCALVTTLALHAGSSNDMKDMKQVSPAMNPSDAGFYVGVEGGVNFSTYYGDRETKLTTPGQGNGGSITPDAVHSQIGGVGGVKAGYNFDSFPVTSNFRLQPAVELEGLYIGMRSKYTGSAAAVGGINDTTTYNNAAGFVNGIVRFKFAEGCMARFVPYLGLGVGVEYVTSHDHFTTTSGFNPGNVGDQDIDFAAQALAGIDYNLNQHWTLFTEYKFVDALFTNLRTPNIGGSGANYAFKPDQLGQNLATVGVKYNF